MENIKTKQLITPPYKDILHAIKANIALLEFMSKLPWREVRLFTCALDLEIYTIKNKLNISKEIMDNTPICEYIKGDSRKGDGRNGCLECPFFPESGRTCGLYYRHNALKRALLDSNKKRFNKALKNIINCFKSLFE